MKIFKDVKGFKAINKTVLPSLFDVQIDADEFGKSMCITSKVERTKFFIPVREEILSELNVDSKLAKDNYRMKEEIKELKRVNKIKQEIIDNMKGINF